VPSVSFFLSAPLVLHYGDGAVWSRSAGGYVTVSAPGVTLSTMVEQYKTLAAAHGLRLDMLHGSLFSGRSAKG